MMNNTEIEQAVPLITSHTDDTLTSRSVSDKDKSASLIAHMTFGFIGGVLIQLSTYAVAVLAAHANMSWHSTLIFQFLWVMTIIISLFLPLFGRRGGAINRTCFLNPDQTGFIGTFVLGSCSVQAISDIAYVGFTSELWYILGYAIIQISVLAIGLKARRITLKGEGYSDQAYQEYHEVKLGVLK